MADLVEPAKADALDKLGEGRQSLGIAAGWVRAKLTQVAAGADEPVAKGPALIRRAGERHGQAGRIGSGRRVAAISCIGH
jgi:hypothetical protein